MMTDEEARRIQAWVRRTRDRVARRALAALRGVKITEAVDKRVTRQFTRHVSGMESCLLAYC